MDKVNERVNNLEHKVCELNNLKESVGELEAKLSSQQMATQACDLRMQVIQLMIPASLPNLLTNSLYTILS